MRSRAGLVVALAVLVAAGVPRAGAQQFVPGGDAEHPRLRFPDSLTSANDRCMVTHSKLNPLARPVYVNGVAVGFCCSACPGTFSKDPERYLRQLHLSFRDPVHPNRSAQLDPAMRTCVNHEIYLFADATALAAFRKDPRQWCGIVTDPVSQVRFRPSARSPRLDYGGRPYFFASDSSRAAFSLMPERFALRTGL